MRTRSARTRRGCGLGTDGFIIIEALVVSMLVAVLTARRVSLAAGIPATAALIVAWIVFNGTLPDASPGLNYWFVRSLFIVIPSALLLGASRLRWISAHVWVLFLLGPALFVGCYIGICELCVRTGVI